MHAVLRALAAGALLAACGGETAIVLEIHKAPGVSSEVKALRVFAGVGHDAELIDPAWWVAATLDPAEANVALDEEMGATTYRYLLRPGGGLGSGDELVFVVAGYKNASDAKPVVFGHTAATVRFGDGEVRVHDFPLVTFEDARHGVTATGCVWWDDEGQRIKRDAIAPRNDGDCDAYAQDPDAVPDCMLDCADDDPQRHPGQTEICADGVDQNCCDDNDGQDDLDGDGFAVCGSITPDCVDLAPGTPGPLDVFGNEVPSDQIHPGAIERCDGLDNDCLLGCDDPASFDPDGDGYLNCREEGGDVKGVHRRVDGCDATLRDCLESPNPGGPSPASVHPDAPDDGCDGWDNDCDGSCDEVLVAAGDQDGDSFPACKTESGYIVDPVPQCAPGTGGDCGGDDSAFEYPGPAERCDGVDFDCDLMLFPTTSPCFVVVTEGAEMRCVVGRRECVDTPGAVDAGFGACTHDLAAPATTVPMEWCTQACAMATDPIQCLTEAGPSCDVEFVGATSTSPCQPPPPDIPLPLEADQNGCSYALIGGVQQGDWLVTLVSPLGGTGPTAMGCGSSLRVVGARPDAEDRVVLVLSRLRPYVFELSRQDGCTVVGGNGLVCTAP